MGVVYKEETAYGVSECEWKFRRVLFRSGAFFLEGICCQPLDNKAFHSSRKLEMHLKKLAFNY